MGAVIRHFSLALAGALLAGPVLGVTHSQLLRDPKMNAKRFANHFEYFKCRLFADVQPADVFLGTETRECDDYAVLAGAGPADRWGVRTLFIKEEGTP